MSSQTSASHALLAELRERDLIKDVTDEVGLTALLDQGSVPFYVGFDPTASSLHLGSLVPISLMSRLQRAGHKPLALVGGATGMIGDPSGKSAERQLLGAEELANNLDGIRRQLERFLELGKDERGALVVDNAAWLGKMGFIEVLRDVGKHLSVNYMMAKDSVRARLEERDQGISYTEFSYMVLQAYDFVHLARTYGCRLQAGASDQWGNITAGIELQRRLGGPTLYGLTCPLLLDSQGNKMGKTAAGAIWLDRARTSPYALYQYLINVGDEEVRPLLLKLSMRPISEIRALVTSHAAAPERREGQRLLAEDVCRWVHGAEATRRAEVASRVMFGGSLDQVSDEDLAPLLSEVPFSDLPRTELERGIPLVDLLARTGLAASKGAARRLVAGGGVYVNNQRATDPQQALDLQHLGTESMLILRAGKKQYHLIRVA